MTSTHQSALIFLQVSEPTVAMSTNSSARVTLAPTEPLSFSSNGGTDIPEVSPLLGVVDVSKSDGPGPGFFVAYSLFALFLIVIVRRLFYGKWGGEAASDSNNGNDTTMTHRDNVQRLMEEQSAEQRAILLSYFEAAQTQLVGSIRIFS